MKPMTSADEREGLSEHFLGLAAYEALASGRRHAASLAAGRAKKWASDVLVMALMLATTAVALFDLYLLGSGLPH